MKNWGLLVVAVLLIYLATSGKLQAVWAALLSKPVAA
jgi:hypothetical protein